MYIYHNYRVLYFLYTQVIFLKGVIEMAIPEFNCTHVWVDDKKVIRSVLVYNSQWKCAKYSAEVIKIAIKTNKAQVRNLEIKNNKLVITNPSAVEVSKENTLLSVKQYTFNEMVSLYKRFMPSDMKIELETNNDYYGDSELWIRFIGGFKAWRSSEQERAFGYTCDVCDADYITPEGRKYVKKRFDEFYQKYGIHIENSNSSEKGWTIWKFVY